MERLSTGDLLVLTIIIHLIFVLKILYNFVTIQAALMRGSTVLSLPLKLVFPGETVTRSRFLEFPVELLKLRHDNQHNDTFTLV